MIKHFCDICGKEVECSSASRSFDVGFGKPGDPAPVVSVNIEVATKGGSDRRATCDNCIRDAVIVALGLPEKWSSGRR
jgi:hypothetical protein